VASILVVISQSSEIPKQSFLRPLEDAMVTKSSEISRKLLDASVELVIIKHNSVKAFSSTLTKIPAFSVVTVDDPSYGSMASQGLKESHGDIILFLSPQIAMPTNDVVVELIRLAKETTSSLSQRPLALALTSSFIHRGLFHHDDY
jgi:hypothetical protein